MKRHARRATTFEHDALRILGFSPPLRRRRLNGKLTCKVCDGIVPKGQRVYCGSSCWDAGTRLWKATPQDVVYWRDKGACAECGLSTEQLIERLAKDGAVPSFLSTDLQRWVDAGETERAARQAAIEYQLEKWGVSARRGGNTRQTLYDVDHIVPVDLFCGDSDELNALDNLQTLCVPCHQKKSARQTSDRAKRRKRDKKRGSKEKQLRVSRERSLTDG